MKKKEIIKYLVFALIGALIIYSIQKTFNYDAFVNSLSNARLHYVLISVLTGVLAVFIRALRWQLLLKPLGYATRLSNAYHATMSGYLVNLGIPRSGEVYRCAALSKSDNVPVNVLVGTVLSERILDMLMLLLVVIGSLLLQFDLLYAYVDEQLFSKLKDNKIALIIVVLILLGGLIFVFKARSVFSPDTKLGKLFLGFFDGIKSIFTLQQPVLFILYTIGIWVCYWMMTYTILLAFDFTRHLGPSGGLSTLVFSSLGVIIPAPAGSATIYSVYIGLHLIYGIAIQQAKALGMVLFSSNFLMIIFAGTISYIVMARRTKA